MWHRTRARGRSRTAPCEQAPRLGLSLLREVASTEALAPLCWGTKAHAPPFPRPNHGLHTQGLVPATQQQPRARAQPRPGPAWRARTVCTRPRGWGPGTAATTQPLRPRRAQPRLRPSAAPSRPQTRAGRASRPRAPGRPFVNADVSSAQVPTQSAWPARLAGTACRCRAACRRSLRGRRATPWARRTLGRQCRTARRGCRRRRWSATTTWSR